MNPSIKQLSNQIKNSLKGLYPDVEIATFVYLLLEEYAGISKVTLALEPERVVTNEVIDQINKAVYRLKDFEPIQYILGKTGFYGLSFLVNKKVLIPRPETEELVDWLIKDIGEVSGQQEMLRILDIGTGSGCIAISLRKNIENSVVTAIDISKEALEIAEKNAAFNGVDIKFKELDVFDEAEISKFGKFDLIVSNPPYVLESQQAEMQPNVLNYEPYGALYVSDDEPLRYYEQILKAAETILEPRGKVYFEINEKLGHEMIALLKDLNYSGIILKADIHERNRMIRGSKSA